MHNRIAARQPCPRLPAFQSQLPQTPQHTIVTSPLEITLKFLAKTRNEAADAVLLPALDSKRPEIRDGALRALLQRGSVDAQRYAVAHLHTFDVQWRSLVNEYRGRMSIAIRDAVLSQTVQLCKNGCELLLQFREYELAPALVNAAEDETNPNRGAVAHTLLQLAELLYEELSAPVDPYSRRDPQRLRHQFVATLEQSLLRYNRHRVVAVLESFLLLANRDNGTLKSILSDPRNGNYLPVADMLTHSPRPGVMRLLLSFLDDPHAPSAAITLLAYRHDDKFIESLLRKTGNEPAGVLAHNLRRIENIAWLSSEEVILQKLDEAQQRSAVTLGVRSGVNRRVVYKMLESLLLRGKAAGRVSAAAALAEFNGAEANTLAMEALYDSDPEVQAKILPQLRQRGIPGAVSKLIELLDSPHPVVRAAARESLAEFSFKRFVAAFDMLEEEVRRSTGEMVAKVDGDTIPLLLEELRSPARSRRLRALAMTAVMNLAPRIEYDLHERLLDEDHLVRAEAARVLALCDTPDTHEVLREALTDTSLIVREAAESSLLAQKQSTAPPIVLPPAPPWQEVLK
jgi:HEAT repeat protein